MLQLVTDMQSLSRYYNDLVYTASAPNLSTPGWLHQNPHSTDAQLGIAFVFRHLRDFMNGLKKIWRAVISCQRVMYVQS